jgi:hypothetical protein
MLEVEIVEAPIAKLSVAGQAVTFERATLVEFLGWRVVITGAAMRETGAEADVAVELTVSGERLIGTVRTTARPDTSTTAKAKPGDKVLLRGVGALRRWGEPLPAG